MVIRVGADIDEFTLARFGICTVLDRRDTPAVGSRQLKTIRIREGHSIVGNGADLMILTIDRLAIGHIWVYLCGHSSRRCMGNSHLREGPSDARKEQNDGYKS